ncbi:MAG: glycosyltransferase [Steroidobacteraceae bacterium]|jgi:rhamnosyltransferase
MSPPKVLVLLAAYNGSRWIADQISSILRQAHVDVHLLISDDGSSDSTLTEIQKYIVDPRVHIVSAPVPSGSAAQNFLSLFRNTIADEYGFVALSDQDDIWNEQKLARACSALIDAGASGYSCAVTAFWNGGRRAILRQVDATTESDFLFEGAGQGCTFVITSDLYRRLREFFLRHPAETASVHYHDWAIYALSRLWQTRWFFDQRPMLMYRQHEDNDTGARLSARGIRMRVSLLKSGWYRQQLFAMSRLCFVACPFDPLIAEWNKLLSLPQGVVRRCRILRFCMRGGRRRRFDNMVLLGAVIAGWV